MSESKVDYKAAAELRQARREADEATRYSDEEIRERIKWARTADNYYNRIGLSQVAQAMMAYNRMINERWQK